MFTFLSAGPIGISGGRCDFCSAEIKRWSQLACLHGLVVTVDDPTVQMTMPGDWDVCTSCSEALGIDKNTLTVPIDRVATYHSSVTMPLVLADLGASPSSLARLRRSLRYAVTN